MGLCPLINEECVGEACEWCEDADEGCKVFNIALELNRIGDNLEAIATKLK